MDTETPVTNDEQKLDIPIDIDNFLKSNPPKCISRNKFSLEEDHNLVKLVQHFGPNNWKRISSLMKDRTPRQCRERYKKYLSGSFSNEPWTPEEDELLLQKYNELGPKWTVIANFFKSRSNINVRNRYAFKFKSKKDDQRMSEKEAKAKDNDDNIN